MIKGVTEIPLGTYPITVELKSALDENELSTNYSFDLEITEPLVEEIEIEEPVEEPTTTEPDDTQPEETLEVVIEPPQPVPVEK